MSEIVIIPIKRIITVDVFYYLPDYPLIIQEFICQFDDTVPDLPRVKKFLRFWETDIDGLIRHIVLAGIDDTGPKKFSTVDEIFSV